MTVLLSTFAMLVGGRSIGTKDFLIVLPFLCAAAATMLASTPWATADRRILLVTALVICTIQVPREIGRFTRPRNLSPWERPLIERVAALPYRTIYTTDYKIAHLARKSLPVDYYSVDHFPLTNLKDIRFKPWLESTLKHCDCAVITDHLLDISPGIVRILLASGKPLIYANQEVEARVFPNEVGSSHPQGAGNPRVVGASK